jgi:hypothetical protein
MNDRGEPVTGIRSAVGTEPNEHPDRIENQIAIGKVAIGLVLDLSNLLHSVYAHAELAAAGIGAGHPAREELRQAAIAARAATALVRRLSVIRRLITLQPHPLDLATR